MHFCDNVALQTNFTFKVSPEVLQDLVFDSSNISHNRKNSPRSHLNQWFNTVFEVKVTFWSDMLTHTQNVTSAQVSNEHTHSKATFWSQVLLSNH